MNIPILVAGILTFVAFLAHIIVGNKESLRVDPRRLVKGQDVSDSETVVRNWVQVMCAFQMVTIDLLVLSGLLFALSTTDLVPSRRTIATGIAVFFALWGVIWLLQLLLLKREAMDYLKLGQWILWFVNSGLVYWGAQTL